MSKQREWGKIENDLQKGHSYCAQGGIRTPTSLRSLPPQDSVSTNSTTWARIVTRLGFEPRTHGLKGRCSTS